MRALQLGRLCVLLCAPLLLSLASALNVSVAANGLLLCSTACGTNGTSVTASVSSLNIAIALAFDGFSPPAARLSVLLNANSPALSFVHLSGAWMGDEPLQLLTQLVIVMMPGSSVTATAALAAHPALVLFNETGVGLPLG